MTCQKILSILQCPQCGGDLSVNPEINEILCKEDETHRYLVVNNIIRFVGVEGQFQYNTHWAAFDENAVSTVKLVAAKEFMAWFLDEEDKPYTEKVFLDVGCGDGNFLPFMPKDAIKIALDYSGVIDLVAERYKDMDNLYLLQGDAQNLPLKPGVVDQLISYGCLNCVPNPRKGMREVARVLKTDAKAGIWGYGTDSMIERFGLAFLRKIYHFLHLGFLQTLFAYALIPILFFVDNSTGIKPGKNSMDECAEIISTNLAPENLLLFYHDTWQDFAPSSLQHLDDFDLSCGQKFQKTA